MTDKQPIQENTIYLVSVNPTMHFYAVWNTRTREWDQFHSMKRAQMNYPAYTRRKTITADEFRSLRPVVFANESAGASDEEDKLYLKHMVCGEVFDDMQIAFTHQVEDCQNGDWEIVTEAEAF